MTVARLAARPRAAAVLALAAFAEAVSWPLPPELTLTALLLAGVVAPRAGARTARWFATPRALTVTRLVVAAGIGSVLGGLLTALAAGRSDVDLGAGAGHALLARTARLAAVAVLAALASRLVARRPRTYPWVLAVGAATFVPGLWLVVAGWH